MKIHKKISKLNLRLFRKIVAKKITDNFGKIKIGDDKIVCFINKWTLKRRKMHFLNFLGTSSNKSLARQFNLDKPIHYIVYGMHFDKGLYFTSGKNTHVTFRNCLFNSNIQIFHTFGEVVFENNRYYSSREAGALGKPFFHGKAEILRFHEECFGAFNNAANKENKMFEICVEARTLAIENSFFNINNGSIDIKARETLITESIIKCPRILIDSDNILTTKSSVFAEENIIIENKNLNEFTGIESPEILYNHQEFSNKEGENVIVTGDTIRLIKSRIELLRKLKDILSHKKNTEVKHIVEQSSNSKVFKI